MKEYNITTKQRIFLKSVKDELPFTFYRDTIKRILNRGIYIELDKTRLNRCVNVWKAFSKGRNS
jgi:hypothetical protein